ncbi:hypothetical protein J4G08_19765 [Candidatus Poribacteria bacterium]|nr:hypothetical protein [Candidatus Poribacteria bacterium]
MNEPWMNPGLIGGILGSIIGILGALIGILGGGFVPRGKAIKLTLGVNTFAFVFSFISLVVGIIANLSGQPYGVWYGFGGAGILGTVLFGLGFWVILKRARDAEMKKLMSEDLTLVGNKKDKEISNE